MTLASESQIEQTAVKKAREAGWLALKFQSPGNTGVPDRLFIKEGRTVFIEFKKDGGRLTELQKAQIRRLRSFGAEVYICYTVDEAMRCLEY